MFPESSADVDAAYDPEKEIVTEAPGVKPSPTTVMVPLAALNAGFKLITGEAPATGTNITIKPRIINKAKEQWLSGILLFKSPSRLQHTPGYGGYVDLRHKRFCERNTQ
jgi:hypothetical protein